MSGTLEWVTDEDLFALQRAQEGYQSFTDIIRFCQTHCSVMPAFDAFNLKPITQWVCDQLGEHFRNEGTDNS